MDDIDEEDESAAEPTREIPGFIACDICVDCILYLANGDWDGDGDPPRDDGQEWSFGGEELGFSWSSCDCCGSSLGGERYNAYIKEKD